MVIPSNAAFLGEAQASKLVQGCRIELTAYTGNTAFEEWHSHQNASISFLLNGNYQEELSGRNYKRIPGNLKFIAAGEGHRCSNYAPGTRKINLDLPDGLLKQIGVSEKEIINLFNQERQAKFTLLKFYHELNDEASHAAASAHIMLYQLFHPAETKKNKGERAPAWVYMLRDILHDEWDSQFDLHNLSLRLGVHPVTISRYFPQYFAATLGNYLWSVRIDKALSLIKGTDSSLTNIAYICGFADQAIIGNAVLYPGWDLSKNGSFNNFVLFQLP